MYMQNGFPVSDYFSYLCKFETWKISNAMPRGSRRCLRFTAVSFLCLALQVFPGPRTRNNEVRGFFMRFREEGKGEKEPKKNLIT